VTSKQTLLGETMVALADSLVTDFDVIELLTMLADRCVTILGVSAAGLMLAGPDGTLRVIASSSEQMRLLELFELQTEQGPCLESFRTGEAVSHDDLSTATDRWPKFAPEAISNGFRAVHALPLRLRGTVIGAMNLFENDTAGIDEEGLRAARAFADIATIAILQYRAAIGSHEVIDQLNTALNTRIVIEQAKGIVSERRHLDMDGAFAALRQHARNSNLRLSDVAAAVVAGTLAPDRLSPESPPGSRGEHRLPPGRPRA
jgi:transcriptional regulator with GAF, ATPase, and Fis domain